MLTASQTDTHPAVLEGWAARKTLPGSIRSSRWHRCSLSGRSTGTTCGCHPPERCWWDTTVPSGAGTVLLPLGTEATKGERKKRRKEARVTNEKICTLKELGARKDAEMAFISKAEETKQVGHQALHSPINIKSCWEDWKTRKTGRWFVQLLIKIKLTWLCSGKFKTAVTLHWLALQGSYLNHKKIYI